MKFLSLRMVVMIIIIMICGATDDGSIYIYNDDRNFSIAVIVDSCL